MGTPSKRRRTDGRPSLALLPDAVCEDAFRHMSAEDLARLSQASPFLHFAATTAAHSLCADRHGIFASAPLAQLRALEYVPDKQTIRFREAGAVRVERGAVFERTFVGGLKRLVTLAQTPACGDAWWTETQLRKGRYSLVLNGWSNPSHGILDLYLDNVRTTPPEGFDFYGSHTTDEAYEVFIDVPWSGVHRLRGIVQRCNADPQRPKRFWMCLRKLKFVRIGTADE